MHTHKIKKKMSKATCINNKVMSKNLFHNRRNTGHLRYPGAVYHHEHKTNLINTIQQNDTSLLLNYGLPTSHTHTNTLTHTYTHTHTHTHTHTNTH